MLDLNFSFTKTCSTSSPSLFLGHGSPELVIASLRVIISSALKDYRKFRSSSPAHQLLCPTTSISCMRRNWRHFEERSSLGDLYFWAFQDSEREISLSLSFRPFLCSITSCAVPLFSNMLWGKSTMCLSLLLPICHIIPLKLLKTLLFFSPFNSSRNSCQPTVRISKCPRENIR